MKKVFMPLIVSICVTLYLFLIGLLLKNFPSLTGFIIVVGFYLGIGLMGTAFFYQFYKEQQQKEQKKREKELLDIYEKHEVNND